MTDDHRQTEDSSEADFGDRLRAALGTDAPADLAGRVYDASVDRLPGRGVIGRIGWARRMRVAAVAAAIGIVATLAWRIADNKHQGPEIVISQQEIAGFTEALTALPEPDPAITELAVDIETYAMVIEQEILDDPLDLEAEMLLEEIELMEAEYDVF